MGTGTAQRPATPRPGPRWGIASFPAIGTTARVLVTKAQRLGDAVEVVSAQLEQLDAVASRFRADSEVAGLASGRPTGVSPLLLALVAGRAAGGQGDRRRGRPDRGRRAVRARVRPGLPRGAGRVGRPAGGPAGAGLVGGRGRPGRGDRPGPGRRRARPRRDRQGVRGRPGRPGRGRRGRLRRAGLARRRRRGGRRRRRPAAGPSGWPTTRPPPTPTCRRCASAPAGWPPPRPRSGTGGAAGSGCTTSSTR